MRRAILVLAASVALVIGSVPPTRAATPIWPGKVIDPSGVRTWITVGSDGVNHVVASSLDDSYQSKYAVDRGNRWTVTDLPARPLDVAANSADHVFVLGATDFNDPNGPLLHVYEDTGTVIVDQAIPGAFHAKLGSIAIATDGSLHAVWGDTYSDMNYAKRSAGVWSSPATASSGMTRVDAVSLALDGSDSPHLLASGTFGSFAPRPAGCTVMGNPKCLVDIEFTDPVVVTTVAAVDPHDLDAITGSAGTIEAVGADNESLQHYSNAGGSWSMVPVAAGLVISGSIALGPSGLVAFYDYQDDVGVRRAERVDGSWTSSTLGTGSAANSHGTVDSGGNAHVVFIRNSFHDPTKEPPPNGNLPAVYVAAPDVSGPNTSTPLSKPTAGKVIGTTIPMSVYWSASDALSGVARYQLQQATSGGAFATVSSTLTTLYASRSLKSGAAYAFRVRGVDRAGNVGAFATGPTIKATAYQQTSTALHWSGTWKTATSTSYYGGSARYATSTGASVSITTTARGFGWVSTYGSTRGSLKIYVDGVWITTINLKKSTTAYRVIAWSIAWPTSGSHTLMIKPTSTARVDIDGMIIVR